jgi:hypothetical protein
MKIKNKNLTIERTNIQKQKKKMSQSKGYTLKRLKKTFREIFLSKIDHQNSKLPINPNSLQRHIDLKI